MQETKKGASQGRLRSLAAGGVVLVLIVPGMAFAQNGDRIWEASEILLSMIEEGFGALVMIVAGLVAIVSSAMGAYRTAMSALCVAVGAFILRTMVALFFPGLGG